MTITTSASDESLQQALALAKEQVEKITELYNDACMAIVQNKKECNRGIEVGKVAIEPQYEEEKKATVYSGITATYEVYVKSEDEDNFGEMIDKILELEGIILSAVEWLPDEVSLCRRRTKKLKTLS